MNPRAAVIDGTVYSTGYKLLPTGRLIRPISKFRASEIGVVTAMDQARAEIRKVASNVSTVLITFSKNSGAEPPPRGSAYWRSFSHRDPTMTVDARLSDL